MTSNARPSCRSPFESPGQANALGDALIVAPRSVFEALSAGAKAAVLHGSSDHFCPGAATLAHVACALNVVQHGSVPAVSVLHGCGGGSARIPKLIGVARMTDMMLTGRFYSAADGERIGLAQHLT